MGPTFAEKVELRAKSVHQYGWFGSILGIFFESILRHGREPEKSSTCRIARETGKAISMFIHVVGSQMKTMIYRIKAGSELFRPTSHRDPLEVRCSPSAAN